MVWDERIEENLRRFENYYDGKCEGREEGEKKGRLENQKEVVINFFKNGVSKDIIAKSTNLSVDEVEKIINN